MKGLLYSIGLAKPDINKEGAKWRREIRKQQRQIDSKIRAIETEESKTQKAMRDAALQNDVRTCQILARQLVGSRRVVRKLRIHKGQLGSLMLQIQEKIALARVAKNLTSSSEIAVTLGKLIKVPHITNSISVMSSELQNAGIISETIDEVVDLTQSDSDIEDEVEGEVNKILASVTKDLNKDTVVPEVPTSSATQEEAAEDVKLTKDFDSLAQRFHMLKS